MKTLAWYMFSSFLKYVCFLCENLKWSIYSFSILEDANPEQFTVVSAYIFILVPHGNQTPNLGIASTMLYQMSYKGRVHSKQYSKQFK